MEFSSSVEVKGEILDSFGRCGNFMKFDEFDDCHQVPQSMIYSSKRDIQF